MKIKDLVLISMFAALTAVGAFIRIPTPICPVTMQIFFTTLAGVLLGGRNGAASVGIYVLLGLAGVPLFTGGGGIHYILHPTFGFLVGFIIGAYITGKICHGGKPSMLRLILGSLAGLVPIFGIGTAYNCLITCLYMDSDATAATVIIHCVMPLPADIILCFFTAAIGRRIIPILERMDRNGRKQAC